MVEDNPDVTKIILSADSCVPQNRNSILSYAIQNFLSSDQCRKVEVIEHKYSEPGHGNLQEIDCAHSCIKRYVRDIEIWSPLHLVRILVNMPTTWKYKFKVLQKRPRDFMDRQKAASDLNYQCLPYTKIKHIIYKRYNLANLKYRLSFEGEFTEVKIVPKDEKTRNKKKQSLGIKWNVQQLQEINLRISDEKKKALKEMLLQMPEIEREFYNSILSKTKPLSAKKVHTSHSKKK